MKKTLTLIMVFVLMLATMVGCGNTADNSGDASTSESVSTSDAETAASSDDTASDELPLAGQHFVIGVNAECAPYESVDENGNIVGFDVDFADALAEKLGFTYEWQDMEFFGLISAVQEERVDMVISCLSGTEERKELVDFSIGYNYSIMCIITKPGSGIETVEDLAGKKVGAATGSNFEALIQSIPGAELVSYDSTVPAVSVVGTPELDALIEISTFAENYGAPAGLEAHVIPKTVAEELAGDRPLAIAFPKGSELVPIFDQAITELEEEGVMDEICATWLGQDYVDKLPEFYGEE